MARNQALLILLSITSLFFSFLQLGNGHSLARCKIDQIYQFGDSISDTGNLIREFPIGENFAPCGGRPYGVTSFKNVTGRCSDGLLIIDYIALASHLPFLNPYKSSGADFRHGANFAVGGSTALPTKVLAGKSITSPVTNSSLDVQLEWMFNLFNSTCSSKRGCGKKLKNALFMVGTTGGNDYNYALLQGKSIDELMKDLVPDVVKAITDAVRRVINVGATRIVVPGNFPIGCVPIYLTTFQTNISSAYDKHHCLKALNKFSKYHNHYLQQAIKKLAHENPKVTILYGDYYNAYRHLLHVAATPFYGFSVSNIQQSCCGTGGGYNFNLMRMCGAPQVPVCECPSSRISWDGLHFTQNAYHTMARRFINDMIIKFRCVF